MINKPHNSIYTSMESWDLFFAEFMNIDIPTAVRIFLKRSVLENSIPFSMSLPKSEYKAERALRALQEISDTAQRNGISDMSLEEINEEIAAVRSKRVM